MDYEWIEDEPVQTQTYYYDNNSSQGNRYQNGGRQRNDRFSSGNSSGGGRSRSWRDRDSHSDHRNDNRQTIKVPSRFVGRIIGKGGSKISDLQYESGCKINVTKEQDGDETVVILMGDEQSRQKAKELINDLTVDRQPRSGFTIAESQIESSTAASASTEPEFIDWQKLSEECVCI